MLARRIIACLDVRDGRVVKGVQFEGLREAGDPAALARRYNEEGIDELVVLDVVATTEARLARVATVRSVASELFIPLAVGGGIGSLEDAAAVIEAGADKVSVNSATLADPSLITAIARRFGSQAVVVAIDARRENRSLAPGTDGPARDEPRGGDASAVGPRERELATGSFGVYARSGREPTGRTAVEWAREAADRGAGEILLTSIDRDGGRAGFDCELTAAVSAAVPIPVIASGGAGAFDHFVEVFTAGRADAALAASIFHYQSTPVVALKRHLRDRGIPVRL